MDRWTSPRAASPRYSRNCTLRPIAKPKRLPMPSEVLTRNRRSRPSRLAPGAVPRMCCGDRRWSRELHSSLMFAASVAARSGDNRAAILSHEPYFWVASHRHGIVHGVKLKPVAAISGSRKRRSNAKIHPSLPSICISEPVTCARGYTAAGDQFLS